ncbi:MAG: glucohydrolase [Sphingomonas sp.]|nr:MAG: glucohydrolase [Sphingomonas sp.]
MFRSDAVAQINGYRRQWWKEAVFYQIYPRSFQDSDGDGVGDLNGITRRLDHLQSLGIDVIWLSPHFQSPNADNGYDISDYRAVMPQFGTMDDFDRMLAEIKRRGMRLILDLVVNHSSDEHRWFQESRKSRDNKYRDYYIWKPGKNGGPPNNMRSFFGGSAWQQDGPDGDWYLHLFARKQPDLNWDNPKVRAEVYDLMRFWLDKGVDGFRMDVIPFISKRPGLPDLTPAELRAPDELYASGPHLHAYLQEMHREVMAKYDMVTVGEAAGTPAEKAPLLTDERRNELNLIFQFDISRIGRDNWRQNPWTLVEWKALWARAGDNADRHLWNTVFLSNHDNPRIVNSFGDAGPEHRVNSAKLLAMLLLTQKGTPFLYQGDEIGMTNYPFTAIDQFDDVEVKGNYRSQVLTGVVPEVEYLSNLKRTARDNARTPMQWDAGPQAGFSTAAQTWLPVNPNHVAINVEAQEKDSQSILHFYRKMIRLRADALDLIYGDYLDYDPSHPSIFCYRRGSAERGYLTLLNFAENMVDYSLPPLRELELLVSNRDMNGGSRIGPWEARLYRYGGAG